MLGAAAAENAVQELSQCILHELQRRRRQSPWPIVCDATGNRFPYAPKLKFNVGANRQISLGRGGSLLLSANLAYNSGYFSEPDNVVRQKAYATVDVSAEWRPRRPGPSVRLWVLNLTDADYYASLATMPTVGVFQSPAAPRRLGVSIGHSPSRAIARGLPTV